ncbi:hypothetical protein HPP92_017021 [Vanilla planifolia]|uniref:Hexosyltransferase n=1 Tax=Vanilla planifolia TaxID=51239 RepID=A0A835USQ0_VANPL|nr:hypothetical protein HPP92_017021 [Vanilla planifolia]
MFVFEPAIATCKSFLATLEETSAAPFADQDFLNMFFKDVYKPIPLEYNLVLAMLWRHPEKVELEKVKVVHYCAAGSKPWSYTGKEENMDREDIKMLVRRWWEIFSNAAARAGGLTRPLMHVMKDAGGVKYAAAPSAAWSVGG